MHGVARKLLYDTGQVGSGDLWYVIASPLEGEDTQAMAELVNRLAKAADEATALGASLRTTIEEQLADAGLSSDEVRQRTDEVIQHWLAA